MIFATVNDVTSIINNFLWCFKGMRDENRILVFHILRCGTIHIAMVTVTSV